MRTACRLFRTCGPITVVALLSIALALGAPPQTMRYQARLTDDAGVPLTGTSTALVFGIYDVASGGSPLWTESPSPVDLSQTNGVVDIVLGETTPIPASVFSGADRWLEVTVDGSVLSPRQKLASVPYALVADSVDGTEGGQFLRSDTSDNYTSGTLTFDPSTVLDMDGRLEFDGSLYLDYDGADGDQYLYFYNDSSSTGQWLRWDDTNDRFQFNDELYLASQVAAVKFVDSDNTSYYLDPSHPASGLLAGTLTAGGHLDAHGWVHINADGPDGDQYLNFYDNGAANGEWLMWDDSDERFWFSNAVFTFFDQTAARFLDSNNTSYYLDPSNINSGSLAGDLTLGRHLYANQWVHINSDGPEGDSYLCFYDGGAATGRWLGWNDTTSRFEFNDEVYSTIYVTAPMFVDANNTDYWFDPSSVTSGRLYGNLEIGYGSDADNDTLFFDQNNESLGWDDSADEFTLSDDLLITGAEHGVEASGTTAGGYFLDSNGSGFAYAGYGDYGAQGHGNQMGLYARDLDDDIYTYLAGGTASTAGSGTKDFVQNHPHDSTLVIHYSSLEGDEVATFTRGTALLVAGETRVPLGETFRWVTNPDIGLTAQLTPHGDCRGLYVAALTTSELVVRELAGGTSDTAFDYIVHGLRIGFEEASVLREKTEESRIPSMRSHRDLYARRPEFRSFNALERFREMHRDVSTAADTAALDFSASRALRDAIQEYDPEVHGPVGWRPPVPEAPTHSEELPPGEGMVDAGIVAGTPSGTVAPAIEGTIRSRPVAPPATDHTGLVTLSEPVETGDVLVADPLQVGRMRPGSSEADPGVVGIVTEGPGAPTGEEIRAPVAFSGIVPCKADASHGAIQVGDLLTTSPTPGHAMRTGVSTPGTILGKALEPLAEGTGTIQVLVMLR